MKRIATLAVLPVAALWLSSCTVKKTEEPKTETNAEPAKEYEIDPAKIEISKDTKTVVLPKVRIQRDTTH
jgi:hypothetical protein